jgi:hypothetical protein
VQRACQPGARISRQSGAFGPRTCRIGGSGTGLAPAAVPHDRARMDDQGTGRDELGKPRARLADVDAELVG